MKVIAGVDIGSRMTKAILIHAEAAEGGDRILGRCSVFSHFDLQAATENALEGALADAGVPRENLGYLAATGYGRYQARDRDIQITEITCHARGAVALMPEVRTILDVGAQNARAIRLQASGRVQSFRMNDKCASGAGRFVERVAKALEIELDRVGPLGLQSEDPCEISSICAVLAESEVINHVTNGETIPNILQGTHVSIADRLSSLVRQVGMEAPVGLTGGVAKNRALVKALEERLELPLMLDRDAEFAGAYGAALLARKRYGLTAKAEAVGA
ncbi:MAG: 2-hydroxyglutaryl-CoA dehydratase [Planctomycetota bacterium]|nr:MAG: 2-hydroxyglutaryl-CoA dehydratase [Planctomycetota bacterium]